MVDRRGLTSLIRLNKFLAESGLCARRKADALIASGAVRIDGEVARLGAAIDPSRHRVTVNGRRIAAPAAAASTLVLNKPAGIVTTMQDDRGRPTVATLLPKAPRYFPIGRLDAASTGVLLCTTDGELARILTHPSFGVERIYRVRATGAMTAQTRAALGITGSVSSVAGTHEFEITLREGRNRQVRRMCAQRGLRVVELERVRFGPIVLGALPRGKTRRLTSAENRALDALRTPQKRATERPTE